MTHAPSASIGRSRGRAAFWDPKFAATSRLFWPVALAASRFERCAAFPTPEEIDAALSGDAGVAFVRQKPVPRRRRAPRDPSALYDARIAREGCVPTRPGSWHDFMNALVWASFPRAKRALHERQHAIVIPAAPGESARRSRQGDALALVDEGGVIVVSSVSSVSCEGDADAGAIDDEAGLSDALARGAATALVFGHAIYEGLVLGREAPLASVICVRGAGQGAAEADAGLAAAISRIDDPQAMLRLRIDDRLAPSE